MLNINQLVGKYSPSEKVFKTLNKYCNIDDALHL